MALQPTRAFYNRVIFNATSGGTGNFVVSAAVAGYRTPTQAAVSSFLPSSYTAESADRTQWETGQGTYTSGSSTYARTTVRENSLGTTAKINFTSAPTVRIDYHAQDVTPDAWVDVRDFAAVPFSSGLDDGPAIQAAIDYAFLWQIPTVKIPDGSICLIKEPIWLDPPTNMRVSGAANPTEFQFSIALVGGEVLGNAIYYGVTIEGYNDDGAGGIDFSSDHPDYTMLVVGPGQGMYVKGLNLRGGGGSLFTNTFRGTGIGISGGPGGASRTIIERCWVQGVQTAFEVGWNVDALGDSNTFIKCTAERCNTGFSFSQTQNCINTLYDCNSHCVTAVASLLGKAVNVYGGNHSFISGVNVDFDISGTTALSSVADFAGTHLGRFSTTITFDPGDLFGFAENGFTDDLTNPVFNCYALETASFGIIPCKFVSYNAGTNTVTLDLLEDWVYHNFGLSFDFTTTEIEAEIQACTILLAAQRTTTFFGPGIHANGVHIENPGTITCIMDTTSGFQGERLASIENMYFNFSPTVDLPESGRKLQSVWPMVNIASGQPGRILGGQFAGFQQVLPWLINMRGAAEAWFEKINIFSPNVTTPGGGAAQIPTTTHVTGLVGNGYWDKTPFVPTRQLTWEGSDGIGIGWVQQNRGAYPAWGNQPAPGATPEITTTFYELVTAAAPIVTAKGEYPIICGGTLYRVRDWDKATGDGGEVFVVSDHQMFSYGQDFTVSWSYRGQSNCLYVDDVGWFFPGLKIGLDNGGGVVWYGVNGVYTIDTGGNPRAGYVTVVPVTGALLTGTKTVTYTDTTIYQELYNFSVIRGIPTAAVAVADLPAASAARTGERYVVNNATATTFMSIVAAAGANIVPVFCDGTNWRIG